MSMKLEYATGYKVIRDPVKKRSLGPWGELAPGQGEDGYGDKITTDRVLVFPRSKRRYRVYATCFSNVASYWIRKDRQKLFLYDWELDK